MTKEKNVIRETDERSIRLAKTLMRTAHFGALATIDPADAWPLATRVGVATAMDGTPIILVSTLSSHTQALMKEPRCALLLGEPAKGDPLAHPRVTVLCRARQLARDTKDDEEARRRYLARHPKAQLYAGFHDFSFFRLEMVRANLNGGFGRAYHLSGDDLVCGGPIDALSALETDLVRDANAGAIGPALAKHLKWSVTGIDPEGVDVMAGDKLKRFFFDRRITSVETFGPALAALALTDEAV